jgi:hypothetical protein
MVCIVCPSNSRFSLKLSLGIDIVPETITHFTKTSSPDLDALLNEIRNNIILPSILHSSQRKKIHSPKWEKKLQSDPIVIEVDGEILKFRYQNPQKDVPDTRKKVTEAVGKFETKEDYANLKPLLEGLTNAQRKLKDDLQGKIVRLAGYKGCIYEVIDCARSARRTGFKLNTSEKVNETLHHVQMKAFDSDWDLEETRKALRWATMVLEMTQDEAHQPKRRKDAKPVPGEIALGRHPMALAAPMHLAAALATRHEAGQEVVDLVHKYAREILALWPEGKALMELDPPQLYEHGASMYYLLRPSKFVTLATPVLHGLDEAIKVVEPELASQLQARRDTLAAEINEKRQILDASRRGSNIYKKFYDA